MEISLSTQVLLSRDLDQWNKAKDIFAESEKLSRYMVYKALIDNGCFSVLTVVKPLNDSQFYNLIFDHMD